MDAPGPRGSFAMTVFLHETALAQQRRVRVYFPGALTFIALSALILNSIVGSFAASIFLLFGLWLIAFSLGRNLQAFLRFLVHFAGTAFLPDLGALVAVPLRNSSLLDTADRNIHDRHRNWSVGDTS